MIDVCCAFILKESKILAVQRGPESSHPWKWEFPGGKINAGETAEESIIREIEEELTVRIEVLQPLVPVEFDYGTKQIRLIPFVCKIASGDIKLTEHIAKSWLYFDELDSIDWSGADRELILRNQESLKLLLLWKNR
ncbi:MAG: NUDIX domain-containing protein [Bacteroidota bacterium]|nr:NUDIX domain-containing protein [Bacteroidota bacterium]MDO9613324.1 NUDIX domain-containing protein [Bacteroidota bacterium]